MVAMTGMFDANSHQPNQGGGGGHPPALKIPFTITETSIVANKAQTGGFFQVSLTSQLGTQIQRYNIWYKGENEGKVIEIAHGQLSALCRATGRYQIDWSNEGAALRGGQGLMDVGYQKGEEPTAEKPNGGYTELKKVYDMAGNEPGKTGAAQPQTQPVQQAQPQAAQPLQQQPGGSWGQQPQTQQPTQQAPQGQPGQAWQPGGAVAGGTQPPWGSR